MDLIVINSIPFVLSLLIAIPAVRKALRQPGLAWGTAGVMGVLFLWLITFISDIEANGPITQDYTWVPDLGLTLSWYLDGLSLFFALIVTGIGVAVFLYAGYYLEKLDELALFYVYLSAFAGAMLALVMAGNIITLFIAWELTSITSFLLIGFKGDKSEDARISASRALLVTGGGGLALLVGLLLMGVAANDINGVDLFAASGFQMTTILNTSFADHPWYEAILVLVFIGAFSKSAQFPFHFWLPGAMSAPSPASAYLHSATMVKAGIYLLFRLYPSFGDTNFWMNSLLFFGLTTMFIGALFAIRKRDLKGLLAYSTVSKLGALVALIGLPEAHGLKAAMIGIAAHAMYKGTFFLLAGTIEHSTGTRNLDQLGGLLRRMPVSAVTAALVGLSMAGVPPLFGFAAKEFLLDGMLPDGPVGILPIIVVFVASVLTAVAALLFVWDVFISRPHQEYHHYHAPAFGLHIGPALLAGMSLVAGFLIAPMFETIVSTTLSKETELYLIPHELNPLENHAFGLSILVLILGPVLFAVRRLWLTIPWINIPSGVEIYARSIRVLEWSGDQLLRSQGGRLRYYLIGILGVVAGLMLLGGFDNLRRFNFVFDGGPTDFLNVILLLLTLGAAVSTILLRRHLLAALAMGVMGYAVGGIFLLEPAPDVALVQFLVETLATVLIIIMIARINPEQRQEAMRVLWKGARETSNFGIWRDIAISTVIGVSVGLFALAAVNDRESRLDALIAAEQVRLETGAETVEIVRPITIWHLENAYPETGVRDVVSSILADFRGTDTLIEISVFAMAALGVLTLLTLPEGEELLSGRRITQVIRGVMQDNQRREGETPVDELDTQELRAISASPARLDREAIPVSRLSTPLTRLGAILVLPFALLISLSHVLYGGEGPGDGFTAGVVGGLAVASWYVVFGYFEARRRLEWLHPGRLISTGLLLAIANAILGLVLSDGFFHIYKLGDGDGPAGLHLASTVIFELAIFLTVFGGVTTIMEAIAHPKEVETDV